MLAKKRDRWTIAALAVFSFVFLSGFVPYTPDANTVLIDHFDGATSASILAYRETGAGCGPAKPSATPVSAYVTGPGGLGQALSLNPPAGEPAGSGTYLLYPGGQLLSQANGTIEFWIYLTTYGSGMSLVQQGPFPGSCDGWTFGLGVNATGQLQAGAWAAFNMDSGTNTVPLNAWTHVAATWGSTGAKLYINGVMVGSSANTGMPASGFGGSVMVNYNASGGTRIDELRISNIQRTTFQSSGGFVPYTPDANTVLIDHFDGVTSASILAYRETGAGCGPAKPSATPVSAYVTGPGGLGQALSLNPPAGEPAGSGTYLLYPGGQLLSQANGTIEFWIYLTTYGSGMSLVQQGPFPGSCAGWTFGLGVNSTGMLQAGAWAAFNMDSGANTVPLNAWTHVAATWGSTGAKLYINGVMVGSSTNTGMPASGFGGSVMVNYNASGGTRIDELRISNIQRTTFQSSGGFVPYTSDTNTVLIDHFDVATGASILAYRETGAVCGPAKPSATPVSAYVTGPSGLGQALSLSPPVGEPAGSGTYLLYPGGQLLSHPNGTIELWIYLTTYGSGLTFVQQGPFPGSCAGWTFGLGVNSTGMLQAGAWAAFNMDSGANTVPLNAWTHVAATWGSTGAKLYINGVMVGSSTNTGMPASGFGGYVMVNYGAGNVGTRIDELRISNIQRTTFQSSGGATVIVSGVVKDWSGNVIPTPGVTVSLVGGSQTTTSSTTDGTFSLSDVPVNTQISLKFSRADYLDVYTVNIGPLISDMNVSADAYGGVLPISMPTASDLTAFGAMPASGKAIIAGRVRDNTYRSSSYVSGVVVTATGNGSKNYPVTYRDPFGALSSTPSTWGNGRYYVLNVDDGDTVTVTASKAGWTFNPRTFHTHGNALSQGQIWGTAPGYDASLSGFVQTLGGNGVSGARIEMNGDPGKYTLSGGVGSFNFNGLPKDTIFYVKVTATNYVPTYSAVLGLPGNVSGVTLLLVTPAEMTGYGVGPGKGLMGCIVIDQNMNPLSGATVVLTSKSGTTYTVNYLGGNGSTSASGRFLVPDIIPGDAVKIDVTKDGYTFYSAYLDGFADSASGRYIVGIPTEIGTVTVSGFVKDWNNALIPTTGVTVSLVGNPAKTTTTSTTDGSFSLAGVPANTPFSLKFIRSGYLDVYTVDITTSMGGNICIDTYGGVSPISMPTAAELTAFSAMPTSGKAVIAGRVRDNTYRNSSYVGGAVVTATSALHPSTPYPVIYRDPFGVLSSTPATWGNGRYYVLNVDDVDTVTVAATKTGWAFNPRTFHTHGDALSQGQIWGTAPGYDASISGFVKTLDGSAIPGARLELSGDPGKFTNSAAGGSYTFSNLPKDANFYLKITADGYVPVYGGPVNLQGAVSGIEFIMGTPTEMGSVFGVTGSNALLACKIINQAMTPLSGATVSLTSKSGTNYTVLYNGGGGSTNGTGQVFVPNVLPGDVVKIDITKAGYTFYPTYLDAFTSSVTEKSVMGTAAPIQAMAYTGYQVMTPGSDIYSAYFIVKDPADAILTVTVEGNGLSSPATLFHDAANHQWQSWSATGSGSVSVNFGNAPPAGLPYTYTFTITTASGTTTQTAQISQFVTVTPSSMSPAANSNLTGTPTFTWASVGGSYGYYVRIYDASGNQVWFKNSPSATTVTYDGQALTSGNYSYSIFVNDSNGNFSRITIPFTYTAPSTVTVSGVVKDWNGVVIPTTGVTVSLVGGSQTTTSSTTDGTFSLSGVPANTPVSLKFSRTGYLDVYTVDFSPSVDVNVSSDNFGGVVPINMPTSGDLTAFGAMPASGKAVIVGRARDNTYRGSSYVGGVVVTATGNGSKNYPVTYRDPFGALSSTPSTWGNGRYYVLNVDDGDTVTVTASKAGWTFNPRTFHTHGNAVSQGQIWGTAPGYDVSISGFVGDWVTHAAIPGARIELNGDPGKYTEAAGDGSYIFSGLPDATFYAKITASGYVNTYAGPTSLGGSITGITYPMLTSAAMTGYGVTSGNGIILCAVVDQAWNLLSGATVTVTSKLSQTYTVIYDGGGSATSSSGRFYVPNIVPGDVVKIDATLAGHTFSSYYLDSFAPSVTAKYIRGASLDETLIQNMIAAALTAYNNKDIDTLMSYFTPAYLSDGMTKDMQRADFVNQFAGSITPLPTTATNIVINGNSATAYVAGGPGTFYLIKTGGNWLTNGNQKKYGIIAFSGHSKSGGNDQYWAEIIVKDPGGAIQSVNVTGTGINGTLALHYDSSQLMWESWTNGNPGFGSTKPATLPTYTLTITEKTSSSVIETVTITGFVDVFITNFSPSSGSTVAGPLTFSWTGVAGSYTYGVELNDASYNRKWEKHNLTGTSVTYDGPALTPGNYIYNILVRDADGNMSMVQVPFTYSQTASTVTISGVVMDWSGNNVISSPGVTVTLVGDPTKTTTASPTNGSFSLPGVPANTLFSLKFSRTGYLDVYTRDMSYSSDSNINTYATGTVPFYMPTESDLTAFGAMPAFGKAVIQGRVADNTYRYSSRVYGAVVTAQGLTKSYPVFYRDPFGVLSSTPGTWGNGHYYVLNVDDADTVTMTATKAGWTFNPRTFHTHWNAVSQARILGTAPGYDVSLSGFVKTLGGSTISGARLELNGDPGKFTNSGADGSYTFSNLPRDTVFYIKVTADDYVPSYAEAVNLQGSASGVEMFMATAAEMTFYGVTGSNGVIGCTVKNQSMSPLSGATVALTSKSGTVYTVFYDGGGSATNATGKFIVPNIQPGDVVKIDVTRAGYTFRSTYMDGFAGSATLRSIIGANAIVGTWAAGSLQYENAPGVWYAEASRITFNADGTGTVAGIKNDGINAAGQRIVPVNESFTYTIASNADGSYALALNFGGDIKNSRLVLSDNGNMAVMDGTASSAREKLTIMAKIDTAKTYSNADLNGEYYFLGFERNAANVVDPPNGNGGYMAISGIHTFKGNGLYDYYGKANSVTVGGANVIWDDAGKTNQPYTVNANGGMTVGGGSFQGAIAGNSRILGGTGSYLSDNWLAYLFMKKGDKTYATADLAGKWAVVGFGQDNITTPTPSMGFAAEIGTIICDNAGTCSFKFKHRWSNGNVGVDTGNVTFSVTADGSFGKSVYSGAPAYAGAIGNNGNTIMFNVSFDPAQSYHREIFIGVRAGNIGDLAGGTAFLRGDINGDGFVNLADAVLALKVVAGLNPPGIRANYSTSGTDVNDDGMIGPAEMVYILQTVAGLRQ